MELEWLRTFLAVVDHGGFAAASEQIHRSQSRVSAHIAALERDLKVTLLDRSQRPVALTHAGKVFADDARDILARVAAARSAVCALRGLVEGDISLLTTPYVGDGFVPALLKLLSDRHPCVRVKLIERSCQELDQELVTPGVVLALRPVQPQLTMPELHRRVLWREPMRLVVNPDHPLAGAARPVPVEALATTPLIVVGSSLEGESEVGLLLARQGVRPSIEFAVDAPQTLVALAAAGLGVGVINSVALQGCSTRATVALDLEAPGMVREVGVFWHDVLLEAAAGRALYEAVLATPRPAGTQPAGPEAAAGSWPATVPALTASVR